jgi:hypothetical protein
VTVLSFAVALGLLLVFLYVVGVASVARALVAADLGVTALPALVYRRPT